MVAVILHDEGENLAARFRPASGSWLVRSVMRLSGGRLKNEREANVVIFILALIIFALAGVISFIGF